MKTTADTELQERFMVLLERHGKIIFKVARMYCWRSALNLRMHVQLRLDRTRASLSRLAWPPSLEMGLNAIGAILNGMFLAGHLREPRFLVPALVVQAAAIILIIVGARQLAILASIDYTAPVVDIQRRLAALYTLRLRTNLWIVFSAALLWPPLAIVLTKGLLGLDLYQGNGMRWIAVNFIFGLAALLVGSGFRCATRIDSGGHLSGRASRTISPAEMSRGRSARSIRSPSSKRTDGSSLIAAVSLPQRDHLHSLLPLPEIARHLRPIAASVRKTRMR